MIGYIPLIPINKCFFNRVCSSLVLCVPRKANSVDPSLLETLRKQVESCLTFQMKYSKDCVRLSSLIFDKTKQSLSSNTLRRFWGFEKSSFSASYATLEFLQRFVQCCQASKSYSDQALFVLDFFEPLHFQDIGADDKTFQASCRKIALYLKSNPLVFQEVMIPLAQSALGRKYFYELFPDYSWLKQGLDLGYHHYLAHSVSKNDLLFGHAILFFSAYLKSDQLVMKDAFIAIHSIWNDLEGEVHPFVAGRVYFTFIMMSDADNLLSILEADRDYEKKLPRNAVGAFKEFPGFHYFVADALYQKALLQDLFFFTNIALNEFPVFHEFEWKGYYDQLRVFHAFALSGLKKKKEALNLLRSVKTSDFYFISKEYYTQIYHQVKQQMMGV